MHNSQVIHNPTENATIFNNFFNSIFTRSTFTLQPLNQLHFPTNQLHTITMDESDILLVLSNLDTSKSSGCNDLSPYILKECAASLISSTTKLFDISLQTSSLPDKWKTQNNSHTQRWGPIHCIKLSTYLFTMYLLEGTQSHNL